MGELGHEGVSMIWEDKRYFRRAMYYRKGFLDTFITVPQLPYFSGVSTKCYRCAKNSS